MNTNERMLDNPKKIVPMPDENKHNDDDADKSGTDKDAAKQNTLDKGNLISLINQSEKRTLTEQD